MIAFGVCIGSWEKYERCTRDALQRHADPDSPVAESSDNVSIHTAYNEMLDTFAERPDLEALVLLHDDVELRDETFTRKVREALADPDVAVLGVIGARGVTGLEWWEGEGVGRCSETRGVIDFGSRTGDADAVDGLLLVLSAWAVRNLRFDSDTFTGFHAYDMDIAFQARKAGKKVKVIDVDLHHHTRGGYGDEIGFRLADAAFRHKWGLPAGRVTQPADCPVCGTALVVGPRSGGFEVELCPECGLGATFPAPTIAAESDEIWAQTYGGTRLARQAQWLHEAQLRVNWLQLYVPDGMLLEVGSGTGEFVAMAQKHGFEAYGVEPSNWAAQHARQLGARVSSVDLQTLREQHPDVRFDVVVGFHVFEHLHEPRAFLREAHQILTLGGTLALEVPNFDSTHARRQTFEWIGPALDGHVHHFTADSLARLLAEEGFRVDAQLEFTARVYDSPEVWQAKRAQWDKQGLTEAPRDMLRVVARTESCHPGTSGLPIRCR